MADLNLFNISISEEAARMYELLKSIKHDYFTARIERSKKMYKESLRLYKQVTDDLDLLLIDISSQLEAERKHPNAPQLNSLDRSNIRLKIRALTAELNELTTSYANDVMQDDNIFRSHKDLYAAVRDQFASQMAEPWSLVDSVKDFGVYIVETRERLREITSLLGRYLEAL